MAEERPTTKFGLVELLVVIFIVGIFIVLFMPRGHGRPAAHNAQCKSNLRQLGLAMHNYLSAFGCFPPGVIYKAHEAFDPAAPQLDAKGFRQTAFELLLPFMEQQQVATLRSDKRPWYGQSAAYLSAVVPTLICPASDESWKPVDNPYYTRLGFAVDTPLTGAFARTDYIFCKGITDAWCLTPGNVSAPNAMPAGDTTAVLVAERGMFDIAFPPDMQLPGGPFLVTAEMITDGTSNAFAAGEGAAGPLTTRGNRMRRRPIDDPTNADAPLTGNDAVQFWAVPPNSSAGVGAGLYMSSIFGCTLDPLNNRPVTHTVIELAPDDICDCRPSFDHAGPFGPNRGGGVHRTSGFRSAHRNGANFVYADGSVQFISEKVAMRIYRALSTIAGGETIDKATD